MDHEYSFTNTSKAIPVTGYRGLRDVEEPTLSRQMRSR
jgi:hypothetical protein